MTRRSREKRLDELEDALASGEGRDALYEMPMMELQFASMVLSNGGEHNLDVDVPEEAVHEVAQEKLDQHRKERGLAPVGEEG